MTTTRTPRRARPNVLGTVRREKSGRFRASYRKDGRSFGAPGTFASERDAHAWLAREHGARQSGTWHDPRLGAITLDEYARNWMAARSDLAPRTRDLYEHVLNRWILPRVETDPRHGIALGDYLLGDLSTAVIRAWHGHVLTAAHASAVDRLARNSTNRAHPARRWARSQGLDVKRSGRMSLTLLDAWQRAGSPTTMRTEHAGPKDQNRDAGRTAAAHAYRLLRTILGTATDDGLIATNPCQIKRAGTVHHPERPILRPAEVDALAATFPPAMRAAVLLAALSGLRFGELFALARRHVDLNSGTVGVERALILRAGHPPTFGPTKTPRSRRIVHVPGFVMEVLREHMTDHVGPFGESLLFTMPGTSDPVGSWYVSRLIRAGRETIGRPDVHWHDLRHVSAVMAYKIAR